MSRIMPAMSDGRSFTNYVSSGLYNNFLESKFGVKDDTEYRRYLQKNAKEVEKVVGSLTAFYVKPPVFPSSNLRVVGDPDAALVSAPVKYDQQILNRNYTDSLLNKQTKTGKRLTRG